MYKLNGIKTLFITFLFLFLFFVANQQILHAQSITGTLEVTHYDDFTNPENSTFRYFLNVDSLSKKVGTQSVSQPSSPTRIELKPTGSLSIISGSKIRINLDAVSLQDIISVPSSGLNPIPILPNQITVLKTAQPDATGDQKTLFLLINFLDSPTDPFTATQVKSTILNGPFQNFYKEQSYNKVSFSGDFFGWIKLQQTGFTCSNINLSNSDINKFIRDNSINLANYKRLVYLVNYACPGYAGKSTVGKVPMTFNGQTYSLSEALVTTNSYNSQGGYPFTWSGFDSTLSHEMGHSLGLIHANGWDCDDQVLRGPTCRHVEYGNNFDVMGQGYPTLHFNAFFKETLGWLAPSSNLLITKSGRYTLNPLETASGVKLIKIQMMNSPLTPFALEYRRPLGFDAKLNDQIFSPNQNGVFVNNIISNSAGTLSARFLDMSPTPSKSWYVDIQSATLNNGSSFYDSGSGITIGPIISNTPDAITFDVKIETPVCTRFAPNISDFYLSAQEFDPEREQPSAVFKISNQDTLTCATSSFSIVPILPTGWTVTKTSHGNSTSLISGEYVQPSFSFSAPSGTPTGTYTVGVKTINLNSGLSNSQSGLINVVTFPYKISTITPSSGSLGTAITLTGQFPSGTEYPFINNTSVLINDGNSDLADFLVTPYNNGQNIAFTFPSIFTFSQPSLNRQPPLGQYSVKVRTITGNTNSVNFTLSGLTPKVKLIALSPFPATFNNIITLIGTGFDSENNIIHISDYSIYSTGTEVTQTSANSSNGETLSFLLPLIQDGTYIVTAETADGSISNSLPLIVGIIIGTPQNIIPAGTPAGTRIIIQPLEDTTNLNGAIVTVIDAGNQIVQTVSLDADNSLFIFTPSNSNTGPFTVSLYDVNGQVVPVVVSMQKIQAEETDVKDAKPYPGGYGIVPCGFDIDGKDGIKGNTVQTITDTNGNKHFVQEECDFNALLILAKNIMDFLFIISASIATICFAVAGIMYLTSGGNPSKAEQAKHIFVYTGVGFIFILGAWLFVSCIESSLLPTPQAVIDYSLLNRVN